jgi:hypothetical protein
MNHTQGREKILEKIYDKFMRILYLGTWENIRKKHMINSHMNHTGEHVRILEKAYDKFIRESYLRTWENIRKSI